jgi:hypothetical protein
VWYRRVVYPRGFIFVEYVTRVAIEELLFVADEEPRVPGMSRVIANLSVYNQKQRAVLRYVLPISLLVTILV